jgi:hypothetical protein
MAAQSTRFDFLEAQMRAYIGTTREPQYLSSGLEDYFLGTYYFNRGLYHLPQAGLTHKDEANHSFSAYRFHDIDPILFSGGSGLAVAAVRSEVTKFLAPQVIRRRQPTPLMFGLMSGSHQKRKLRDPRFVFRKERTASVDR